MGRPRKEIDAALVGKLAAIQCTMEEIASVCDCSVDTLERRFAEVIEKGRAEGCASLRRRQVEVAMRDGPGSATMLVWLGKIVLHQSERLALEHSVAGAPVEERDVPTMSETEIYAESAVLVREFLGRLVEAGRRGNPTAAAELESIRAIVSSASQGGREALPAAVKRLAPSNAPRSRHQGPSSHVKTV